ncbi:hypothetical protein [Mesorhizobium sp. LSJC285A00]|uniref:hypothetical protein n=1 Tax=Mesorhizobium sp. LSJC285A00 TaxID=1287338 RepID=UPI0004166309|nr:hypothetical protein [Mesorhizobium sp. LSJC285A00]
MTLTGPNWSAMALTIAQMCGPPSVTMTIAALFSTADAMARFLAGAQPFAVRCPAQFCAGQVKS